MRRILVLETDKDLITMISKCLNDEHHAFQIAENSAAALHRLKAWKPHLLLLSKDVLGAEIESFIAKVRSLTMDDYICMVLMTKESDHQEIAAKSDIGVDDHIVKPFRELDIIYRVRAMLRLKETQESLKRANHRIEELLSADELTGLMNMRAVFKRGEEIIARSKKFHKPISSLLINIDAFSIVNQNFGFLIGSQVLQAVALRIKQCLKPSDIVARVGADEFFVLLAETDLAEAETIAIKVRDSIQAMPFKNDKASLKLTATIGVAGLNSDPINQRMSDLIHISSEALKSAKASGANHIEVYSYT